MYVYMCLYACVYVCLSVCVHMDVCMHVCMYVRTYACTNPLADSKHSNKGLEKPKLVRRIPDASFECGFG